MPHYPGSPYAVVKQFEEAIAWYTGAPHVVTTESCTSALHLACRSFQAFPTRPLRVSIPKYTYVGVAQSIEHAGFEVAFRDEDWKGKYRLLPLPVWDCARRFTKNMYVAGEIQCVSFHWEKILGLGRGGAILTDDNFLADWCRRARFDGRTEGVDPWHDTFGWGIHAYMTPEMAATGLIRLWFLPEVNPDQPNEYSDLSKQECFR